MQTKGRFFDDVARAANGAAGLLSGLKDEGVALARGQAQRLLADMDLVTREEFNVVRDMACRAREENEQLSARLTALEAAIAGGEVPPTSPSC